MDSCEPSLMIQLSVSGLHTWLLQTQTLLLLKLIRWPLFGMVPRFCNFVLSVCLFIYQLAYDVMSLIRSRVRDSSCFVGNSPTHWAVVMRLTIQANLCSVTVAVMEPRFCLSSTPVRAKECLWVPASDWGAPVDLFHALSVGQQEGQKHRQYFLSLFSASTWLKNCTPHFL